MHAGGHKLLRLINYVSLLHYRVIHIIILIIRLVVLDSIKTEVVIFVLLILSESTNPYVFIVRWIIVNSFWFSFRSQKVWNGKYEVKLKVSDLNIKFSRCRLALSHTKVLTSWCIAFTIQIFNLIIKFY